VSPHDDFAYTNYLGVSGADGGISSRRYEGLGMFPSSGEREDPGPIISLRNVTDGTSNTLFVGERPVIGVDINGSGDLGWWAAGLGWRRSPYGRCDYILDSSEGLRKGSYAETALVDATHFWSRHPQGAEFLFVDGSVRMLFYDIDHNVFLALSTRNGHETISE
jgi:prepilin-type processing-associated H-X9-DG protein